MRWLKPIAVLASQLHKSEPQAFRPTGCSAYDCEFVALAIKLNTHLVTMDKKLLRAFPKCALALTVGL